eukprot:scaffold73889_cov66-Attheya_sp.AAC.3
MSGHQSSLLLRKGVTGEAYYPPSKTWHVIRIDGTVHSLDDITVKYTKRVREWGRAHEDILRCLNVGDGGSSNHTMIYQGMMSMCRDSRCESELVDDFPAYRFGTVTAVNSGNFKEAQIEFEFATDATSLEDEGPLPSGKIQARGSDLLYWAVPNNLVESEAASRMGVESARDYQSNGDEEGDDESDEDDVLPPRKRRAPSKFSPGSDSDSSSSDAVVDKELFPDSDDEEEEVADNSQPGVAEAAHAGTSWNVSNSTSSRSSQLPASSSWGTPSSSLPSRTVWGTPPTQASNLTTGSGGAAQQNAWGVATSPNPQVALHCNIDIQFKLLADGLSRNMLSRARVHWKYTEKAPMTSSCAGTLVKGSKYTRLV